MGEARTRRRPWPWLLRFGALLVDDHLGAVQCRSDEDARGDALEPRAGAESLRAQPLEQVGGRQCLLPLGHREVNPAPLSNSGQLLHDGVLVYTVDMLSTSGHPPLRIAPDTGNVHTVTIAPAE